MKFVVTGKILGNPETPFKVEVEAESEKHARELAIVKIGSSGGIKGNRIEVKEVKKQ